MKLSMLMAVGALAAASQAQAGVAYFNGSLSSTNVTFNNPNGSSSGPEYYFVYTITVDTSGSYVFETASPNTSTTGTSNALDTNILLYANSFNAASPSGSIASSDDFTGTLTVLPGPYAPLVSATATGFSGAQPASRFTASLTAGTTYYLVESSFRQVGYVNTTDGAATGAYYAGISGPGSITVTPAPASAALMGLGGLLAARRRRK